VCDEPGVFPRTRYGEVTVSCVGYGTLVLPYGTFADCLLLHRHWSYYDDYDDIVPGFVDGDAYSFVRAGLHVPLLSISYSTYTQGDSTIVNQGSSLLSETSTGLQAAPQATTAVRLRTDPATGEVMLQRDGTPLAQVSVLGADGRTVYASTFPAGVREVRLPLASSPAGIYLVRLRDARGEQTVRVVREQR
jgi:hypothetical protein